MTTTGYSPRYKKGDVLLGNTEQDFPRYSLVLQADRKYMIIQVLHFTSGVFQNGTILVVKPEDCFPDSFKRIGCFSSVGIFKDDLTLYKYKTTKHRLVDDNKINSN